MNQDVLHVIAYPKSPGILLHFFVGRGPEFYTLDCSDPGKARLVASMWEFAAESLVLRRGACRVTAQAAASIARRLFPELREGA